MCILLDNRNYGACIFGRMCPRMIKRLHFPPGCSHEGRDGPFVLRSRAPPVAPTSYFSGLCPTGHKGADLQSLGDTRQVYPHSVHSVLCMHVD